MPKRSLEVGDTAVQTHAIEREEAVVAVELSRPVADGVHHHRASAVVTGSRDRSDQRVTQQIGAEPGPPFPSVERQPREEEHANGRPVSLHAPHRERVVPEDEGVTTEHPRRGKRDAGATRRGSARHS